ncbi:MAG: hypothetical protein CSA13_01725 [Clostridiales bacterium]|nr:MAG: hypothetical protein CSA13_01725 [Clostridiales bacterium]
MTTAYLYRQNNHYSGFEIDGHADYNDDQDIVCAAVSISSITACNALEQLLDIKPNCTSDETRGYLKCELPKGLPADLLVKSDIIIGQLSIALTDLAQSYPEHVMIYTKEVL